MVLHCSCGARADGRMLTNGASRWSCSAGSTGVPFVGAAGTIDAVENCWLFHLGPRRSDPSMSGWPSRLCCGDGRPGELFRSSFRRPVSRQCKLSMLHCRGFDVLVLFCTGACGVGLFCAFPPLTLLYGLSSALPKLNWSQRGKLPFGICDHGWMCAEIFRSGQYTVSRLCRMLVALYHFLFEYFGRAHLWTGRLFSLTVRPGVGPSYVPAAFPQIQGNVCGHF